MVVCRVSGGKTLFLVAGLNSYVEWQCVRNLRSVRVSFQRQLNLNFAFVDGQRLISKLKFLSAATGYTGLTGHQAFNFTRHYGG